MTRILPDTADHSSLSGDIAGPTAGGGADGTATG